MSIEIKKTETDVIAKMAIKCGLMVCVAMTVFYYGFTHPSEVFDKVMLFYYWFDTNVIPIISLLDLIPFIPTILLCGLYGWLQCLSIKLSKLKVYTNYLNILFHAVPFIGFFALMVVMAHELDYNPLIGLITCIFGFVVYAASGIHSNKAITKLKKMKEARNASITAEAA